MKFVDPPSRERKSRQHWIEVVAALKAAPGRFGLVGVYSSGVGTHIRQGLYKAFYPAGHPDPADYMAKHWEVVTRRVEDRKTEVYVRWLGE